MLEGERHLGIRGNGVLVMPNMCFPLVIYHDDLRGVTTDQHHAKLHQADHQDGGVDEIAGPLDLAAIPTPLTGKSADYVDNAHAMQVIISGW